jgi:phosphoglycolate phosphatase-like HAD superfamily hydrolase
MTPLASWNDGSAKSAIVDFVDRVVRDVAPPERVAVFDNDGTLWCEKPAYIQLDFIIRRLAAKAAADPGLAREQPYLAASSADLGWFGAAITRHYQGDDAALKVLAAAVISLHESMAVEDHAALVSAFFAEATHPTLGRPYRDCVYTPMVELLRYLEEHQFSCYIVSGGARDFMRPVTEAIYGIPPERVVGSAQGLRFTEDPSGHGDLLIQPTLDVFDDGPEKPVRIWSRIGRRPMRLQMRTGFSGPSSNTSRVGWISRSPWPVESPVNFSPCALPTTRSGGMPYTASVTGRMKSRAPPETM